MNCPYTDEIMKGDQSDTVHKFNWLESQYSCEIWYTKKALASNQNINLYLCLNYWLVGNNLSPKGMNFQ